MVIHIIITAVKEEKMDLKKPHNAQVLFYFRLMIESRGRLQLEPREQSLSRNSIKEHPSPMA